MKAIDRVTKITRDDIVRKLEEIARLITEEVDTDELTDYAREKAYIDICDAVAILNENAE